MQHGRTNRAIGDSFRSVSLPVPDIELLVKLALEDVLVVEVVTELSAVTFSGPLCPEPEAVTSNEPPARFKLFVPAPASALPNNRRRPSSTVIGPVSGLLLLADVFQTSS